MRLIPWVSIQNEKAWRNLFLYLIQVWQSKQSVTKLSGSDNHWGDKKNMRGLNTTLNNKKEKKHIALEKIEQAVKL